MFYFFCAPPCISVVVWLWVDVLQALVDDANACRRKMDNATALIDGLSGERRRWTDASESFEAQTARLVGDVLLATGFLSYSGPFNQEFRSQMMTSWKTQLRRKSIPFSDVSVVTVGVIKYDKYITLRINTTRDVLRIPLTVVCVLWLCETIRPTT